MANLELDDLEFQRQFELAKIAATKANLTEPSAIAAYYDRGFFELGIWSIEEERSALHCPRRASAAGASDYLFSRII